VAKGRYINFLYNNNNNVYQSNTVIAAQINFGSLRSINLLGFFSWISFPRTKLPMLKLRGANTIYVNSVWHKVYKHFDHNSNEILHKPISACNCNFLTCWFGEYGRTQHRPDEKRPRDQRRHLVTSRYTGSELTAASGSARSPLNRCSVAKLNLTKNSTIGLLAGRSEEYCDY